jgi:hypothetical protein
MPISKITQESILPNTSSLEEKLFFNWLTERHTHISAPHKYVSALKTISNDLNKFDSDIGNVYLVKDIKEGKELYKFYFDQSIFEAKNNRGNNMYSRAFDLYLQYITELPSNETRDISEIIADKSTSAKEKEILILTRIGQGKFRNDLIKIWKGCTISKYQDTSLLVASHIKPWSKSEPFEKTDPYNGLLLLPTYDKLFDKGLISFNQNGKILISTFLNNLNTLNINDQIIIDLKEKNKTYMEYHSKIVFKSN